MSSSKKKQKVKSNASKSKGSSDTKKLINLQNRVDQLETECKVLRGKLKQSGGSSRGRGGKVSQEQFFALKKELDAEKKKSKNMKKILDQTQIENKVLRNKLKNVPKKRGKKDDKRLRQLMRENRELRKRLRKMMKEVNKKRRYYRRAVKIFKNKQNVWIKAQKSAWKNKKFIIKYVFLDDVKYIKQYQRPRKGRDKIKFRNRVRIKTKDGGEVTLKDVEIIVMDDEEEEEDDDDNDGSDTEDVDGKKKQKKKKKKKKKKGTEIEKEDEMENYMSELMKEFGINENDGNEDEDLVLDEDDLKSIASDEEEDDEDDPFGGGDGDDDDDADDLDKDDEDVNLQFAIVRQEMDERGNDLDALKDIMVLGDNAKEELDKLHAATNERQQNMVNSLEELNCGEERLKEMKDSNDEWKGYMLSLSQKISDELEKRGEIKRISDGFLKELRGRIQDLQDINNVYYDEEDNKADFEQLKKEVDERHDDISKEIGENDAENDSKKDEDGDDNEDADIDQQAKELVDGLLQTNRTWNDLISTSSESYKESVSAKNHLIRQLLIKYDKLNKLTKKVESMPATVLF